ncbi:MAG: hypothetical protein AB1505_03150 [Candidatus Latescibacterota bacterium]
MRGGRVTLLIIPEAGGRTREVKLSRLALLLAGILGAAMVLVVVLGLISYLRLEALQYKVSRLEREKAVLSEEVGQIRELEQVLQQLERSNRQLRAVLGERGAEEEAGAEASGEGEAEPEPVEESLEAPPPEPPPGS